MTDKKEIGRKPLRAIDLIERIRAPEDQWIADFWRNYRAAYFRLRKERLTKPEIPMSPTQLPRQRIVALADLPERPEPFESVVGYDEKPTGVRLCGGPSNAAYLAQVEWAWSSMNGRVDAYYLHKGRHYWMLWIYSYDDNWEEWNWLAVGFVPRAQATERQAAVHLLVDFWRFEKEENNREHYHWINETGELDSSVMRTIGLLVWPQDPSGGPD